MTDAVGDVNHEVMIEGKGHPWNADTISVSDIRELGGLPADTSVIEEDLRDGSRRALAEDEVIHPGQLEAGKPTTKKVNFRAGE